MSDQKRKKKPAKRPPPEVEMPPPRKAVRVPMKRASKQPKTQIVPDDTDTSLHGLRYAAGKDYVCTFKNVSLQELCQRPMYRGIPERTMGYWCKADGWVERRRAFREEYRKALDKAIVSQLVQTRHHYMKKGEKTLEMLFDKLIPENEEFQLEPTSLEALANATRQWWDKLIEEKEKLADAIMPEPIVAQQEGTTSVVRPQLSQAEARAAALTVVRMRRDEIRASLKAQEAEQPAEEKKPHMRVIDGEK